LAALARNGSFVRAPHDEAARDTAQEGTPACNASGGVETPPYQSRLSKRRHCTTFHGLTERHWLKRRLSTLRPVPQLPRAFLLLLWLGRFVEVPFFLGRKNGVCVCVLAYTYRRNALVEAVLDQVGPAAVVRLFDCHHRVVAALPWALCGVVEKWPVRNRG